MELTKLTFGDTEIARIGLGTNRLTSTPANVAFIKEAVAAGVGMIDSAHSYTSGESELTIGAALSPVPGSCIVATKGGGPGPGRGRAENLRAEIEESLRRLRTDSIALYYLHRVDPETPIEESLAAIKEYRDRGKIRLIGISEVSIDQIERARAVAPIAAVQNHYNLSERKHEAVVDYCTKENIVFVPFFPLRGDHGRVVREMAVRYGGTPAQIALAWLLKRSPLRGDHGRVVREMAVRYGATPTQIALAWLLKRSPAILPIPGTLSREHLKENMAALQIALSDADFEMLRSGLGAHPLDQAGDRLGCVLALRR